MNSKLKGLTFFCLIAMILMCPVMMPCAYASSYEVATQQDIYKTVYLKNGTEIKGTATEEDGMIKVVSISGDVFYFSKEEIREIYDPTEAVMRQREKDSIQSARLQKKELRMANRLSGYFLSLDVGSTVTPSSAIFSKAASVSVINGYRACNWFQLGAGLDYAYYNYGSSFAAYFHMKFSFAGKKKVSPYLSQEYGFRFGSYEEVYDGFIYSSTFGVQFNINDRNAVSVGINYGLGLGGDDILHSLGVKLGYTFYSNKKK